VQQSHVGEFGYEGTLFAGFETGGWYAYEEVFDDEWFWGWNFQMRFEDCVALRLAGVAGSRMGVSP
jgi:hypothetical protein